MSAFSPGFRGRRRDGDTTLPPGQHLVTDFPVLSIGPTPQVPTDRWRFEVVTETGRTHGWSWAELQALPQERPTVDLHCVTTWSKLGTRWQGVSLDLLLDEVETAAEHVLVESYGGYTTNLGLDELRDGRAWVATGYDGAPLTPEHGGPARLLVPHLYLWKSAKWVRRVHLLTTPALGLWENAGYHSHGDPWREQRYTGD